MAVETALFVGAVIILALVVFLGVLAVSDAVDAQPDFVMAACLWLVLIGVLIWLVTR